MHRGGISPPNPNKWGGYHPLTHIRGWISPPRRGGYPPPVGSSCDVGIGFLLYFLSIFPHFSFWYRNILVSVPSHIQNQLEIFPVKNGLRCPDEKETGWKQEAGGVPEPGNDPATPLDLALGITPPAPAPVDMQDQGINLPPLQTNPRPKKTSPKGPLAMMRPRVKCSRCDFTGKQGKEMDSHVERKHKTEFKCKVCNFVTRTKALRRRHMKSNHERKVKCENQQ